MSDDFFISIYSKYLIFAINLLRAFLISTNFLSSNQGIDCNKRINSPFYFIKACSLFNCPDTHSDE